MSKANRPSGSGVQATGASPNGRTPRGGQIRRGAGAGGGRWPRRRPGKARAWRGERHSSANRAACGSGSPRRSGTRGAGARSCAGRWHSARPRRGYAARRARAGEGGASDGHAPTSTGACGARVWRAGGKRDRTLAGDEEPRQNAGGESGRAAWVAKVGEASKAGAWAAVLATVTKRGKRRRGGRGSPSPVVEQSGLEEESGRSGEAAPATERTAGQLRRCGWWCSAGRRRRGGGGVVQGRWATRAARRAGRSRKGEARKVRRRQWSMGRRRGGARHRR